MSVVELKNQIQFHIRVNQVGIRHILRQQQNYYNEEEKSSSSNPNIISNNNSILPCLLEELEPDMVYYFLQQKPDVMLL